MKIVLRLLLVLCLFPSCYRLSGQSSLSDLQGCQIENYIVETMKQFGTPGAAVAIIKDNEVLYKNYFGKSNLEYNIPVTSTSVFRLHSLSKIFVAVGIFQLVEQNKISLDDPISQYLNDLPEKWRSITIANLLSHSSGLPDMREESNPSEEVASKTVYAKEIQFERGYTVSYNQTNFWLLNRIIRKISDDGFQKFILGQFQNDSNVLFSNDNDIVPNRVTEYKPNDKGELQKYKFMVVDYLYGAGGLTLSLDDFIDWDKKISGNHIITEESKFEMLKEFRYQKAGAYAFTYGWFIQNINNIQSYGFNGGGLVNYRRYPNKGLSIIWLTNGYRIPHNIDDITNAILGFVDVDLKDKAKEVEKLIYDVFSTKLNQESIDQYHKIKRNYEDIDFETVLNNIGYAFLSESKVEKAIVAFRLNTQENPDSANAFDSLAESYFMNNQLDLSSKNYRKSLELDPVNENAKSMIDKIEKLKSR